MTERHFVKSFQPGGATNSMPLSVKYHKFGLSSIEGNLGKDSDGPQSEKRLLFLMTASDHENGENK
jgi:hypothetical protein